VTWRRAIGLRRHEPDADPDVDEPARATDEPDEGATGDPGPVRSRKATRVPSADDADLKPTAMRGNELLYGYLIAGELILVAILNLAITHGKGAPAHPNHVVEILGLVVSLALLAILQTRQRFIVPFAMILGAYLVVYPKTPDSLTLAHLFALVLPVIYAIILMQRQRKASLAQARARSGSGSRAGTSRSSRPTPDERRAEAIRRRQERRDRRRGITPSSGPTRSSRYTPPKPRRPNH
jgi:hypothetical protein